MKPPEVLTRDRLLATYEVRPTLAKLRSTLLGMGGILLVTALLLLGLIKAGTDADGVYGRGSMPVPRQVTAGAAGAVACFTGHWQGVLTTHLALCSAQDCFLSVYGVPACGLHNWPTHLYAVTMLLCVLTCVLAHALLCLLQMACCMASA